MANRTEVRRIKRGLQKAEKFVRKELAKDPNADCAKERLFLVRWIKENLHIRAKGGGLRQFNEWTHPQKVVAAHVVKCFALKRPARMVIHKSRQLGMSTIIQAIGFSLIHEYPEIAGMVFADLGTKAEFIFSNVERFHRYLPDTEKDRRPVKGGRAFASEITYEYPHRSEIYAATGDTDRAGAGFMLCFLHVSESAHIPNLAKVMLGVMPAVPSPVINYRTLVVHESTANGKEEFYRLCKRAQKKESNWTFFFFGLKDDPDAALPLGPGETLDLDEEEAEYAKRYDMSMEQMKWCRWKRLDECGGSWEYFHQEYPVESELAFQFSGMPFFNRKRIAGDLEKLEEPDFQGFCVFSAEDVPLVSLAKDVHGPLLIWKHPQQGKTYSLAADVGLGVGADYSECHVLDDESAEQVALYRSNVVEPGQFAVETFKLGMLYNCGILAVENNSIGQGTVGPLKDGHGRVPQTTGGYPNLYCETRYDKTQNEETDRVGFSTSGKTKMPALEAFREAYNSGFLKINARITLEEMDGFAFDSKRGKLVQNYTDPKTGLHNDDSIMAMAIANTLRIKAVAKRYCAEPEREDF